MKSDATPRQEFADLFINREHYSRAIIPSAIFTSIWLWLYAGSGFLLKAARRFDVGFEWFNRKFDIEKKPLQSIGLVAGSIAALVYWGAALLHHFLSSVSKEGDSSAENQCIQIAQSS